MSRPVRLSLIITLLSVIISAAVFCVPVNASSSGTQKTSSESSEAADADDLTDLLSYLVGRYIAGDIETREELKKALEEGQQQLGIELSPEQMEQICDSVQRIATQGLGAVSGESGSVSSNDGSAVGLDIEGILKEADGLSGELDEQIKQAAQEAIRDNVVEPVKEALAETVKMAVRDFFSDMKNSISDFFTHIFQPNAD